MYNRAKSESEFSDQTVCTKGMVINMRKCRIGVVGIGRGSMMWNYCKDADNAELVAICDKWEQGLENV